VVLVLVSGVMTGGQFLPTQILGYPKSIVRNVVSKVQNLRQKSLILGNVEVNLKF